MAAYLIKRTGNQIQVILQGDLIASMIPNLQNSLRTELETDTGEVVFDLMNTGMMDSSGIGLLIATSNTIGKNKGQMRVINVAPDIYRLMESMRLVGRLKASGRDAGEVKNG
jgi:anti-anti-sigma factor